MDLIQESQLTMVLSVSHFKFLIEKVVPGTSRRIVKFACDSDKQEKFFCSLEYFDGADHK